MTSIFSQIKTSLQSSRENRRGTKLKLTNFSQLAQYGLDGTKIFHPQTKPSQSYTPGKLQHV